MPDNKTSAALVDSLRKMVEQAIDVFRKAGIRAIPTRTFEAHWMEPVDESHSTGKIATYTEQIPLELLFNQRDQLAALQETIKLGQLLDSVAELSGGYPASLWSLGGSHMATRLLGVYLYRAGRLAVDTTVVQKVVDDYMTDMSSPTVTARAVFQIVNFTAVEPFKLSEEIELRPLTHDDIKEYWRHQVFSVLTPRQPWLNITNWICEINRRGPRNTFDAFNSIHDQSEYVAMTLSLAAKGSAEIRLLSSQHASPFLSVGRTSGGDPIRTSVLGGIMQLGAADINLARELFPTVVKASAEANKGLNFALRRLLAAAQRRQLEDSLVDHVVALESLLSPDSDRLETTFRFQLRGAALLPADLGTSSARVDLMKKLYDMRSRIVHGDGIKQEDLRVTMNSAEDTLRYILRWYLSLHHSGQSPKRIVQRLGEAMVEGGRTWAQAQLSPAPGLQRSATSVRPPPDTARSPRRRGPRHE